MILFCDTETTGIDPAISGAFEIACLVYEDEKFIEEKVFHLNPLTETILFSEEAYQVNGVSEDTIKSYPPAETVMPEKPPAGTVNKIITTGFIEIFNERTQIIKDYRFTAPLEEGGEGGETVTEYFYNGNILTRAETRQRIRSGESAEYQKMYTDTYRYNRSYFLRNIERTFHTSVETDPSILLFPGRIMEMARDTDLIKEKISPVSDFIENNIAEEGYRIVFDTDTKGRILTQTMYDDEDGGVWVIQNNWTGDRIASILRKEGDDEKLTEYEYNGAGDRIAQRDINNGVLERQVITDGAKETEELFMNGVVVLRAFYENGRKISEERIRRR
jgi:YD repeat-containing protein